MYNEIFKAFNAEMVSFEAQKYHNKSYEALLSQTSAHIIGSYVRDNKLY